MHIYLYLAVLVTIEIFENLPRKCFACNICQKFVPSLTQPKKCAICDHMDEVHEQVNYFIILYDISLIQKKYLLFIYLFI